MPLYDYLPTFLRSNSKKDSKTSKETSNTNQETVAENKQPLLSDYTVAPTIPQTQQSLTQETPPESVAKKAANPEATTEKSANSESIPEEVDEQVTDNTHPLWLGFDVFAEGMNWLTYPTLFSNIAAGWPKFYNAIITPTMYAIPFFYALGSTFKVASNLDKVDKKTEKTSNMLINGINLANFNVDLGAQIVCAAKGLEYCDNASLGIFLAIVAPSIVCGYRYVKNDYVENHGKEFHFWEFNNDFSTFVSLLQNFIINYNTLPGALLNWGIALVATIASAVHKCHVPESANRERILEYASALAFAIPTVQIVKAFNPFSRTIQLAEWGFVLATAPAYGLWQYCAARSSPRTMLVSDNNTMPLTQDSLNADAGIEIKFDEGAVMNMDSEDDMDSGAKKNIPQAANIANYGAICKAAPLVQKMVVMNSSEHGNTLEQSSLLLALT